MSERTELTLTSPTFEPGGLIPSQYTCDGENINPPLLISNVPEGTISLALLMDDPDVPKEVREDQMFDHWILYNIEPTIDAIEENVTFGSFGKNTSGSIHYRGPCPPGEYEPKEHRYFFKLYALDTTLNFEEAPTKEEVEKAMDGHIISTAELIGRYARTS